MHHRQIEFEDLQALYDNFNEIIQKVTTELGLAQNDIMIDVTGGTKTASIAAALVTLHHPPIEFQYVRTETPFDVLSYNVVTTNPVHLES